MAKIGEFSRKFAKCLFRESFHENCLQGNIRENFTKFTKILQGLVSGENFRQLFSRKKKQKLRENARKFFFVQTLVNTLGAIFSYWILGATKSSAFGIRPDPQPRWKRALPYRYRTSKICANFFFFLN